VITQNLIQDEILYHVDTEVYSGPLDLLLELIQKAELDITKLALASVTDQYLLYIEKMQTVNANDISEFLVIAAKLIQIKSEALLPRPPIREDGEEDLGEILARQLIIYREIKRSSQWLKDRDEQHLHTYLHIPHSFTTNIQLDLSDISLDDLVNSLKVIYTSEAEISALGTVISIPKITFRKKIQSIITYLSENKLTTFRELLGKDTSRLNMIIVFLAILELTKQHYITTDQDNLFGNFKVIPTNRISSSEEFDLTLDD